MKRAALVVVLLAACTASSHDFPTGSGGGVGGGVSGPGGGGTTGDAGIGDGGDGGGGDAGVLLSGRVCIVKDLRHLTVCDTTQDASKVVVTLGTRTTTAPPAKTGEFTILAQLGNDLVWRATGVNFVTSVMPFGTDNTIPIMLGTVYTDLLNSNSLALLAEGQGSVVVRAVTGTAAATGVSATTTLVSGNVIPLYDADTSAVDWREVGPTQMAGVMWFPGVQVTTAAARITLTPAVGTPVPVAVDVVDQAITFLTQDVQ